MRMKDNEYYIYGCTFYESSSAKVYDFRSKDEIPEGAIVLIKCKDYRTNKETFKEVKVVNIKGLKECTERELNFYKEILSAENDD